MKIKDKRQQVFIVNDLKTYNPFWQILHSNRSYEANYKCIDGQYPHVFREKKMKFKQRKERNKECLQTVFVFF